MRGRFGSPPWLEEAGVGDNRSQLARGGRKLGAAKVILGQPFLMVVAGDCGDGDGKGEQNIAVANHEERKLGRRKICFQAPHNIYFFLAKSVCFLHNIALISAWWC